MLSYKGTVVAKTNPHVVKTKRGDSVVTSLSLLDKENPTAVYQHDCWGTSAEGLNVGDELMIEVETVRQFNGRTQLGGTVKSVNGQARGGVVPMAKADAVGVVRDAHVRPVQTRLGT